MVKVVCGYFFGKQSYVDLYAAIVDEKKNIGQLI
jgi:hypothetical protein